MAAHRATIETTMIRYAEQRWGRGQASGRSIWKRKFDLDTGAQDWQEIFNVASMAGVESGTLFAVGIRELLKEKGVSLDASEIAKIEKEIIDAAEAGRQSRERMGDILGE